MIPTALPDIRDLAPKNDDDDDGRKAWKRRKDRHRYSSTGYCASYSNAPQPRKIILQVRYTSWSSAKRMTAGGARATECNGGVVGSQLSPLALWYNSPYIT
jgi:hypothetical protein